MFVRRGSKKKQPGKEKSESRLHFGDGQARKSNLGRKKVNLGLSFGGKEATKGNPGKDKTIRERKRKR